MSAQQPKPDLGAMPPICGDAEPHLAHDTGLYEPGKPRHHGFPPVRCPGVGEVQALRYALHMAEERCETWKRQCGEDQEKVRQLHRVLDEIVAERDGMFDRVQKLIEMGQDEDRGLTSDSVCDAAWAKALAKALSPQSEDQDDD